MEDKVLKRREHIQRQKRRSAVQSGKQSTFCKRQVNLDSRSETDVVVAVGAITTTSDRDPKFSLVAQKESLTVRYTSAESRNESFSSPR